MSGKHDSLSVAEQVAAIMQKLGMEPVVMGALALATHHYMRFTQYVDLGVDADLQLIRDLQKRLNADGFTTALHEPDMDDPLGGVLNISGDFGLVQVVNFGGRFPVVIQDALAAKPPTLTESGTLRIVPLAQLVALKLYAGGLKSKVDIVELLRRNPDADLSAIRKVCDQCRLKGLEEVLAELGD